MLSYHDFFRNNYNSVREFPNNKRLQIIAKRWTNYKNQSGGTNTTKLRSRFGLRRTIDPIKYINTLFNLSEIGYEINGILGFGTVGSILNVMNISGREFALKAQEYDKNDFDKITKEVQIQESVGVDYGPGVYHQDTAEDTKTGKRWHYVIMNKVGRSFDKELMEKQSPTYLDNRITDIMNILEHLGKNRIVHGDLAWFNMCWNDNGDGDGTGRIVLIDFDRSVQSDDAYSKYGHIDLLRLIDDIKVDRDSQAEIHPDNRWYLFSELLKKYKERYLDITKAHLTKMEYVDMTKLYSDNFDIIFPLIDQYWYYLYCSYCNSVGVLCLGGVCDDPDNEKYKKIDII